MRTFTETERVEQILDALATGQDTDYTDVVDTDGFDSVTMLLLLGAIADTGTVTVTAQQGTLSNGSDMADLSGSGLSAATADDNGVLQSEIYRPRERYVRWKIVRATADSDICGAVAILRDPQNMPVTLSDDIADSEHLTVPAEA